MIKIKKVKFFFKYLFLKIKRYRNPSFPDQQQNKSKTDLQANRSFLSLSSLLRQLSL
jgi:hypothetical protein